MADLLRALTELTRELTGLIKVLRKTAEKDT